MKVYKFGGGVLDNAHAIEDLVKIVCKHKPSVVVVSAMGKTTNELEKIYSQVLVGNSCDKLVSSLFSYYESIILDLFGSNSEAQLLIQDYNKSLISILSNFSSYTSYECFYSSIVAVGELLTSQLVNICLSKKSDNFIWTDARSFIKTSIGYTNAEVDWVNTEQMIKKIIYPLVNSDKTIITQGFIGSNQNGETTTLGREGSDYTAAIIAKCTEAKLVTLYKNVPGVMTANPELFKDAEKLNFISYNSLQLVTHYGSKLVHKKTIEPLRESNIDLHIKNFYKDGDEGTLINNTPLEPQNNILLVDRRCLFVSISSNNDRKKTLLSDISKFLSNHKATILISTQSLTLKLCISTAYYEDEKLIQDLRSSFDIIELEYAYIISILYAKNYERYFTKRPKLLMWIYDKTACQVVLRNADIDEYSTRLCKV